MKVLHLTSYSQGGAGVAAQRIVNAERAIGIEARLMTGADFGIDPHLTKRTLKTMPHIVARKIESMVAQRQKTTNPVRMHSLGFRSLGIVDAINQTGADIVHLHWINDGLLSIADVPMIRKTLVWTMHDNWVFCGAEHSINLLENDCRYRDGYSQTNRAASSSGWDVDRFVWRWKIRCWKNLKCVFTAPSRWETNLFCESVIGHGRKCLTIPNCIQTDVFCPGDKCAARKRLGIAPNAKVVAFGAMSADDPNKGLSRLAKALEEVRKKSEQTLSLLVFGSGDAQALASLGYQLVCVGGISESAQMVSVYRAADVFVCPSIVESFSLTCAEAMSCGTPAVSFDASGTTDIIEHLKTGYLAKSYDVVDLACGIVYCVDHSSEMSAACRKRVTERFSENRVASAFREVYGTL